MSGREQRPRLDSRTTPHRPCRRCAWVLLGSLWGLSACRTDGPPVALHTSAQTPDEDTGSDAPSDEPGDRDLWFADGPGRDAILARERQDHARAVELLDRLLARDDLTTAERAGAQWLRGLEDVRLGQFEAAADRFAEARQAEVFAPVRLRLVVLEAQARLDAGQPKPALALVSSIAPEARHDSPLGDDILIIEGDARSRSQDDAGARASYEEYLRRYPDGARRHEARVKLARVLARSKVRTDVERAVDLYEQLLLETPLSDYGNEAAEVLPELEKEIGRRRAGKMAKAFERRLLHARIDAHLQRRQYKDAVAVADKLLSNKDLDPIDVCRALYAKGTAIFKQRRRNDARGPFDKAAAACKKAGAAAVDHEVKSRYQAARGLYAEGKYAAAARAFEQLARDHADHSYADDAWVLAAESWYEHRDPEKMKAALRRALDIGGDMRDEATRRMLVTAFAEGDDAGVLAVVDGALSIPGGHPGDRARLVYFKGRALARRGDQTGARAAWLEAVRTEPLGYASLQALSRLREAGQDVLAEGIRILEGTDAQAGDDALAPPGGDAGARALILARLGLGDEAAEELRHAKFGGWSAVAVLNQAGLYREGQRLIANMGTEWRTRPPSGPTRRPWELAHPKPFWSIIHEGERGHRVPALLTFAIMQTESLFDPGVTSWAGARGLVQLMPSTAKSVARDAGIDLDEASLYDPSLNLDLGMRYLGKLVARFGGHEAAAALAIPSYNAGAGAVNRWLTQHPDRDLDLFVESIPYDETRNYTQRVLGRWLAYRWLYGEEEQLADRIPYLPLRLPG